jgi:pimeloyl-ACP methyl ester carboxylesterase
MAQRHEAERTCRAVVRGLLVVGAAALALSGCARAPEPAVPPIPLSSSAPVAAPTPRPDGGPGPAFTPCRGDLECATVPVPVDYANPTGPTTPIAIARRPAANPAAKLGVLLVNPGGPGGSGIELVQAGVLPREVTDRFDVIGFDPRGVGDSTGLQCPLGPETPYLADPDPGDPADEAATNDSVDRYDAACGQRYRDLLPHLGTRNVARDMDRIREALGEDRINYLGFSYGTSIGQTYAQLFPTRLRAMVLDGVVDVTKPGLDSAQAESFENSLRQFDAACRTDPTCPVRADPIGTLDRVRARVTAAPLPVAGTSPLSAGLLEIGVVYPLYSQDSWPQLAQALAAADRGDGAPMRSLATAYFRGSNSDTYNAVTCLDNAWPTEDEQVLAAARVTESRAPHFSGNVLVSGLTCSDWPAPQQPLTPLENYAGPPMLIVGTTNDPATPYQNSVALSQRVPGSALLTYRGEGHTVYTNGVPCVDDTVNRYLLDGVLPPPNTTCQ